MPQKRPHGCLVGTEEAPCLRLGEQTPTPQATPKLRVRPKQQDAGSLWCRGKTERRGRKEMPMGPRNGDRKSCSSLNLSCSGRKQRYSLWTNTRVNPPPRVSLPSKPTRLRRSG